MKQVGGTSSCAVTILTAIYVKKLWRLLAALASGDASPNPAMCVCVRAH